VFSVSDKITLKINIAQFIHLTARFSFQCAPTN